MPIDDIPFQPTRTNLAAPAVQQPSSAPQTAPFQPQRIPLFAQGNMLKGTMEVSYPKFTNWQSQEIKEAQRTFPEFRDQIRHTRFPDTAREASTQEVILDQLRARPENAPLREMAGASQRAASEAPSFGRMLEMVNASRNAGVNASAQPTNFMMGEGGPVEFTGQARSTPAQRLLPAPEARPQLETWEQVNSRNLRNTPVGAGAQISNNPATTIGGYFDKFRRLTDDIVPRNRAGATASQSPWEGVLGAAGERLFQPEPGTPQGINLNDKDFRVAEGLAKIAGGMRSGRGLGVAGGIGTLAGVVKEIRDERNARLAEQARPYTLGAVLEGAQQGSSQQAVGAQPLSAANVLEPVPGGARVSMGNAQRTVAEDAARRVGPMGLALDQARGAPITFPQAMAQEGTGRATSGAPSGISPAAPNQQRPDLNLSHLSFPEAFKEARIVAKGLYDDNGASEPIGRFIWNNKVYQTNINPARGRERYVPESQQKRLGDYLTTSSQTPTAVPTAQAASPAPAPATATPSQPALSTSGLPTFDVVDRIPGQAPAAAPSTAPAKTAPPVGGYIGALEGTRVNPATGAQERFVVPRGDLSDAQVKGMIASGQFKAVPEVAKAGSAEKNIIPILDAQAQRKIIEQDPGRATFSENPNYQSAYERLWANRNDYGVTDEYMKENKRVVDQGVKEGWKSGYTTSAKGGVQPYGGSSSESHYNTRTESGNRETTKKTPESFWKELNDLVEKEGQWRNESGRLGATTSKAETADDWRQNMSTTSARIDALDEIINDPSKSAEQRKNAQRIRNQLDSQFERMKAMKP